MVCAKARDHLKNGSTFVGSKSQTQSFDQGSNKIKKVGIYIYTFCHQFSSWFDFSSQVEHSDLKCISINCTKGRHRSVAAAETPNSTGVELKWLGVLLFQESHGVEQCESTS